MLPIHTILHPTDFSARAKSAFDGSGVDAWPRPKRFLPCPHPHGLFRRIEAAATKILEPDLSGGVAFPEAHQRDDFSGHYSDVTCTETSSRNGSPPLRPPSAHAALPRRCPLPPT